MFNARRQASLRPRSDNIDVAFINVGHSVLDYKLLVVPADYLMDAASAQAIRNYVANGGTVIMAAFPPRSMSTIDGSIRHCLDG